VEWKTPKPVAVGSRVAFVAEFLGRRLAYTYEVREFAAGELVMSTAEGPFPMETTYTWEDDASGGTRMTLRNRGEPAGFAKIAAPMMAGAMRRANRKDLRLLKEILEQAAAAESQTLEYRLKLDASHARPRARRPQFAHMRAPTSWFDACLLRTRSERVPVVKAQHVPLGRLLAPSRLLGIAEVQVEHVASRIVGGVIEGQAADGHGHGRIDSGGSLRLA
jgi:hypothetical protein